MGEVMTKYAYAYSASGLKSFLTKIREVGKPTNVTQNWLKSIGFKSSNDIRFIPVLQQLGFIDNSKKPTELWDQYRGSENEIILAKAIRRGYADLFETFPNANKLTDNALYDFFSEHTNSAKVTIDRMVLTFKALCEMADFNGIQGNTVQDRSPNTASNDATSGKNISDEILSGTSYSSLPCININIQLTLPETKDSEVYENLFVAMKKHLFSSNE